MSAPDSYNTPSLEWIDPFIKSVFSWIILMPISVIVTGKLLSKPINFTVNSTQLFQIPLKILVVQATQGEVVLGFSGFIITLFGLAVFDGVGIYSIVKTNFGIDPGQFNSLCMFSSFATVVWSFAVFLIHAFFSGSGSASFVEDVKRYDDQIQRLENNSENQQ